ncbi:MAG: hypothetical protein CBC91_06775 [Rickettsiales bacterium TMED131]|jgi:hypothetical protein|nr:MAG: hypothetical protein CBC91_06775 [Rickettsiales bacterium TMED131]|tara:strand:+ start:287 stop:493 length:207 start_codon:yes stop_codon:yes gene_type:complete
MEGNIISFKVFVNSKGILMSEYSKLPVEKVTSVFNESDTPLIKKVLSEVERKVGDLHEQLEKELDALN